MAAEGFAIALYCVLLFHEFSDPHWTRDGGPLNGLNKDLAQASIYTLAIAAVLAFVGLIFDNDRIWGIMALSFAVLILVLMGVFQGIW